MLVLTLRRRFLSVYFAFSLIITAFMGALVIEREIIEIGNVKATDIIVDANGNGDYLTIQDAINNSNPGDTIYVWEGFYKEFVSINHSINLVGNSSSNTTLDGDGPNGYGIYINQGKFINISGFEIINAQVVGIRLWRASYVKIHNNTFLKNHDGIRVSYSDNVTIKDNNITDNQNYGIEIMSGSPSMILKNTISNNPTGIFLNYAKYTIISKNTMVNCGINIRGPLAPQWSSHSIDSTNTVNGMPVIYLKRCDNDIVSSGYGQVIFSKCSNMVIQNQNYSNGTCGILIGYSINIIIKNNTCSGNKLYGIKVCYSKNITIENNIGNFNGMFGIYLFESSNSDLINNTCNYNHEDGFWIYYCEYNNITNNIGNMNNNSGLYLDYSENNVIKNNNFYKNYLGIRMVEMNNNNKFSNNIISNNSFIGISISSPNTGNSFYHNNIISNTLQALDSQSNNNDWSKNSEGNYWSDYTGVDNGSGGRVAGDGIGDTKIPHPGPGFDFYPFIMPYGWWALKPPLLIDPGNVDPDGNYTLYWESNPRAEMYLLEEDDDEMFDSPLKLYKGLENSFVIKNKSEGNYYYRVKIFNQYFISNWSNIVNITVDFPPEVPKKFNVSAYPFGNTLNLSWEPNIGETKDYMIFYKTDDVQDWTKLVTTNHPNSTYNHTGLIDGQIYNYRIKARDRFLQKSDFSKIINGMPIDSIPPKIPTGLSAKAISNSKIELTWDASQSSQDDDIAGYSIFINTSSENEENEVEEFKLFDISMSKKASFTITGLVEKVNYSFKINAFDEVPNYSLFSNIASAVTPDETPPLPPTDLRVINQTYNSITITWNHSYDEDVVGYFVYRSKVSPWIFIDLHKEPVNGTSYVDTTGLEETTKYYYKLKAIDSADLLSSFSDYTTGTTLLGPKPPESNNYIEKLDIEEDTTIDQAIKLNLLFNDPNNDHLYFRCEGANHITVNIDNDTGYVTLIPKKDWNGEETLTFYANDSMFEIYDEITITVTSVNDPPGPANIITPADGIEISENDPIDFSCICSDPDLIYGDVLNYTWSSNMDDIIGYGQNLTGIILSKGVHVITLKVIDSDKKNSTANINVKVIGEPDEVKTDGEKESENYLMIIIVVLFILILIIIVIFLMLKRKKKTIITEFEEEKHIQEPQILGPDQPEMEQMLIQQPQELPLTGEVTEHAQEVQTRQQIPEIPPEQMAHEPVTEPMLDAEQQPELPPTIETEGEVEDIPVGAEDQTIDQPNQEQSTVEDEIKPENLAEEDKPKLSGSLEESEGQEE